jgi:hypothetical protein
LRRPSAVFHEFDHSGDGELDWGEFKEALNLLHLEMPLTEARHLFRLLDHRGAGSVSYHEFATAIFPELELDASMREEEGAKTKKGGSDFTSKLIDQMESVTGCDLDGDGDVDGDYMVSSTCTKASAPPKRSKLRKVGSGVKSAMRCSGSKVHPEPDGMPLEPGRTHVALDGCSAACPQQQQPADCTRIGSVPAQRESVGPPVAHICFSPSPAPSAAHAPAAPEWALQQSERLTTLEAEVAKMGAAQAEILKGQERLEALMTKALGRAVEPPSAPSAAHGPAAPELAIQDL